MGIVKNKVMSGDEQYSPSDYRVANSKQTRSIEDGGSFYLPDGDILYINEQFGPLDPWEQGEPEYWGIGTELESGYPTYITLIYHDNYQLRCAESSFNAIYDLNNHEYDEGNILRVWRYSDPNDDYRVLDWSCYEHLKSFKEAGLCLVATLVIRDGMWHLIDNPEFTLSVVRLNSNEEIRVSGLSQLDGVGISFDISSGKDIISYYMRDGDVIFESSYNYFSGVLEPQEDDNIYMYDISNIPYNQFEDIMRNHWFDIDHASDNFDCLCVLRYIGDRWIISHDYT